MDFFNIHGIHTDAVSYTHLVAQSAKIYNKLNLPISMVIYPYQNVNLKYEFGWIKKNQTELTRVERTFISEIMRLFR